MENLKTFHHGNLREELIVCAAAEIEKLGYDKVSIREIAKKLGVSQAALYRHFSSKKDLLIAIFKRRNDKILEAYADIAKLDINPKQRLQKACELVFHEAFSAPELYKLLSSTRDFWTTEDEGFIFEKESQAFNKFIGDHIGSSDHQKIAAASTIIWSCIKGYQVLKSENLVDPAVDLDAAQKAIIELACQVGK